MDPKFPFPFPPYPIQEKFMKELYTTIENSRLGIFESPTGTGKSLSICCGTLQWLKDSKKRIIDDLEKAIEEIKKEINIQHGTDDWLKEEYDKIKKNRSLVTLQNKLDKIKRKAEAFNELQKKVAKQKSNFTCKAESQFQVEKHKNKKHDEKKSLHEVDDVQGIDEDDLIVVDYCDKINPSDDEEESNDDDNDDPFSKIYISSRTHSQISQFVGEIKRTVFNNNTRVVTLASRQHYCINSQVIQLKNVNLINERCLDMQKSKTKSTSTGEDGKIVKRAKTSSCTSCPYYNQTNINRLKDRLLVDILDMEDLVKCGKELKACPYYATRIALDEAEVVLISHAGIVSTGARSGMSLKLENNVLILDEAHGLTAALENAHSAPVSYKQMSSVKTYLQFYINKYRSRLSSKNLLLLNQVYFVVGKLLGILKPPDSNKQASVIYSLEDFVIKAEIDHLNLRPLVEFCRITRLAPKLHGFSMRYNQQVLEEENVQTRNNKKSSLQSFLSNISKKKSENDMVVNEVKEDIKQIPTQTSAGTGLYAVLDFLEMLCHRSENGRVLVNSGDDEGHLKYLLLNPAEHFAKVVGPCRSVIVAGGTMEPVSEFRSLLSDDSDPDAVVVVKCEHVVPPENVLAVCLSRGPTNVSLNFSYENRMSNDLLSEVGRILRNVCSIVPGGVVCFLPSYSYEQTVYDHLKKTNIIDNISKKKVIFREPKSAGEVDKVLHKFAFSVRNKATEHTGALLLSVVGGKLSEGLNFSDDLGRCVIVVGMPYPNIKSPELQEKMSYLNKKNSGAGSVYYENLCMKAVNQCIGRAVRHANDYACVLLVDERYSRVATISALPSFVQKSLISNCTFGQSVGSIAKFFARHKHKT